MFTVTLPNGLKILNGIYGIFHLMKLLCLSAKLKFTFVTYNLSTHFWGFNANI